MTDNDFIRGKVGTPEILAQLAEEAAELGQAALKYRRAIMEDNPTPVKPEDALEALREEIADVDLCIVISGVGEEMDKELPRMSKKRDRWIKRLGGKQQPCRESIQDRKETMIDMIG